MNVSITPASCCSVCEIQAHPLVVASSDATVMSAFVPMLLVRLRAGAGAATCGDCDRAVCDRGADGAVAADGRAEGLGDSFMMCLLERRLVVVVFALFVFVDHFLFLVLVLLDLLLLFVLLVLFVYCNWSWSFDWCWW